MNRRLLLLLAISSALVGCHRDPVAQLAIESKNNELRMMEDTLYDMQRELDDRSYEIERLRDKLDSPDDPSASLTPGRSDGSREPQNMFPPDPPGLDIDSGTPNDSNSRGGDSNTVPGDSDLDDLEPPRLDLGGGELSSQAMPSDRQITQIHVNAARTGGRQRDKEPGDDAVAIVFEPRNDKGQFVPAPAPISVALLDPESRQRVARWEVTAEQMKLALQQARPGAGVSLELPWQSTPPTQSRLHLYVRYWLPDGKAVQGDSEITITPNGQLAARWTPRTEQRPRPRTRVSIADKPGTSVHSPSGAQRSGKSSPADNQPSTGNSAPQRQAQLPQWRPYR